MSHQETGALVAIKSHQRLKRFGKMTHSKILLEYGFKPERVYIFVSTEKDLKEYAVEYPNYNIVLAPLGVAAVDNFITQYFDQGQKLVYMNDDVSAVKRLNADGKLQKVTPTEFWAQLGAMFLTMTRSGVTYAGFYPVANNLFMKSQPEYSTGLKLIMDPLSLLINNQKVKITVSDKSDFEKSILHYNNAGALLRYNRWCLTVEYYGKVGGFQGRTPFTEHATATQMLIMYPNHVGSIKTKKDGKTSLRLKRLPPRISVIFTP